MPILGIDVSIWDPIVAWQNFNWDFAIIKASEGTVEDPKFKKQWEAARSNVIRSAYHFFRPSVDPVMAARKFVQILGNDLGEMPMVNDLEATDNIEDISIVAKRAITFNKEIKHMTGITPIIYSSPNFLSVIRSHLYPEFAQYPLWLAQYYYDNLTVEQRSSVIQSVIDGAYRPTWPQPPRPWTSVPLWQFTAKGLPQSVPGYPLGSKLAVDINLYKSATRQALIDEFKITPLPPRQGEEQMQVIYNSDLKSGLTSNVRRGPGLGYPIVTEITGPVTVQITAEKTVADGYDWYPIVEPAGYIAHTERYTALRPVGTAPVTKKIVKSVIHWDDNSTETLYPEA